MLPTLPVPVRTCRPLATRAPARVWIGVAVGLLLGGCGNKGDLYLPFTSDEERRLDRIGAPTSTEIDPSGDALPVSPPATAPTTAPGPVDGPLDELLDRAIDESIGERGETGS